MPSAPRKQKKQASYAIPGACGGQEFKAASTGGLAEVTLSVADQITPHRSLNAQPLDNGL